MRTRIRHRIAGIAAVLAVMTWAAAADARCTINSAGLTITPTTASTGTVVPPNTPGAQSITFTVSGTYTTNAGANLTCTVGISFRRAALPASMALTGSPATTMPYTVTSSGGSSLLYTTTATAAVIATSVFTAAGTNRTNVAFSRTISVNFTAQPGTSQAAGGYTDALTVHMFDIRTNGTITDQASRAFSVTGTVNKACTIGGIAHPSADTATITITAAGKVTVAPIAKTYANALCNTPSNVQLTSQNGAVRNPSVAPTGFTNLINYSATAVFSGASSSLNTSTVATATGPESGTVVATTGTIPSGTLSVTITPQANVVPLLLGSYTDTLTITITPQ